MKEVVVEVMVKTYEMIVAGVMNHLDAYLCGVRQGLMRVVEWTVD